MLVEKVDCERNNRVLSKTSIAETKICCSVSSSILCNTNGFSGWLASLPLLNLKSLNLDTALLQCLSKCTQLDCSEIHQVSVSPSHQLLYDFVLSIDILECNICWLLKPFYVYFHNIFPWQLSILCEESVGCRDICNIMQFFVSDHCKVRSTA